MKQYPEQFDLIVLGAGVIGVSTAYWARQSGMSVAVVERNPGAALETSFANGGQIAVSHAQPWANPAVMLKILRWLFDEDAPLLFRPRLDWRQWWWLAAFLRNCTKYRAERNARQIIELAMYSREQLAEIRATEGIQYDEKSRGILHFYRDSREFEEAVRLSQIMNTLGCRSRAVSPGEAVEIEPALADVQSKLVGATYSPDDESGDVYKFTHGLANICENRGVRFFYGTEATALELLGGPAIGAVECRNAEGYLSYRARHVAVCLGSFSAPFLRPLGVRLNLYPAKGYSITLPVTSDHVSPEVSLTDDEHKLVYSRLGDRLRVAGTAELSGYDGALNRFRCRRMVDRVRATFPAAGCFEAVQYWAGLRPATPEGVPHVGPTRIPNLWLNTGHGTLGWTMGPGSGRRLAEQIVETS